MTKKLKIIGQFGLCYLAHLFIYIFLIYHLVYVTWTGWLVYFFINMWSMLHGPVGWYISLLTCGLCNMAHLRNSDIYSKYSNSWYHVTWTNILDPENFCCCITDLHNVVY